MGLIDGAPVLNPPPTPSDTEGRHIINDMGDFQERVIRSKEAKHKKVVKVFTPHLDVFDITNPKEKLEFEDILRRIGDPACKVEMGSPYKIENVIDATSTRGYRTIVILDWFEYESAIEDKTDQMPDLSIINTQELINSRNQQNT